MIDQWATGPCKVVVTGGVGFIGANLVRRLTTLLRISEVVVVDDLSTGSLANIAGLPVLRVSRVLRLE